MSGHPVLRNYKKFSWEKTLPGTDMITITGGDKYKSKWSYTDDFIIFSLIASSKKIIIFFKVCINNESLKVHSKILIYSS